MDERCLTLVVKSQLKHVAEDAIDWEDVTELLKLRHTALQCKEKWREIQTPICSLRAWSNWEDACLRTTVRLRMQEDEHETEDTIDWDDVSKVLNACRSAEQCRERWNVLRNQRCGSNFLQEWSDENDAKLLREVRKQHKDGVDIDWKVVSLSFDNSYTMRQCEMRFEAISKNVLSGNVSVCLLSD